MSAIGMIGGAVVGGIMDTASRNQQNAQTGKWQHQQNLHEIAMMDKAQQQQYEMWKKTNYKNQVAEMKAAGLNPALMYKGSGAGGMLGSASPSPRSAPNASSIYGTPQMMGIGMEMENKLAQNELLKAQTEKTKAEANKIAGVDTELANAGVDKSKAEKIGVDLDNKFKEGNYNTAIDTAKQMLDKLKIDTKEAVAQNKITEATSDNQIKLAEQNVAESIARQWMISSNISVNDEQKKKIQTEVWKYIEEVGQNESKLDLQAFETRLKAITPSWDGAVTRTFYKMGEALDELFGRKNTNTKVEKFRK